MSNNSDFLNLDSGSKASKNKSSFGFYGTIGFGAVAVAFSIAAIPFITPALRKHTLPYVPATQKQIENVFKAIDYIRKVDNLKTSKLIDLGSGDGRIVFEAAKRGFNATGVEINSLLYLYSRFKSLTTYNKVSVYKPKFLRANLWNVKMNDYDYIVVFGVQEMMKDLANKLDKEIKPTTKIVSCRFPIDAYKSIYKIEDEIDSVWIYDKNSLKIKEQED